jgi:replication factor C subunit 2/4
LWHPRDWNRRVLELNASDERGISVVRDKIKHFASLTVGNSNPKSFFAKKDDANEDEKKYPNPPFKVIILDEADTVTPDAQAALRRIIVRFVFRSFTIGFGLSFNLQVQCSCKAHQIIVACGLFYADFLIRRNFSLLTSGQEANSKITRFILICNYVTRIIEPLASRCAKFRFQALPAHSMKDRLLHIAKSENCDEQTMALVDCILDVAGGDMRRAVTTLQSVHSLSQGGAMDEKSVAEIAGIPPKNVVEDLWNCLLQDQFDVMRRGVDETIAAGFSAQLMMSALLDKIMDTSHLAELGKAEVAVRIAEAEKNMIEGADEYLQLMTVCSLILGSVQRK